MRLKLAAIFTALIFLVFPPETHAQAPVSEAALRNQLARALPAVSVRDLTTLIREGELSRTLERSSDPFEIRLAPAFGGLIEQNVAGVEPTIGVEVLFLLDLPAQARALDVDMIEIMHAISTMEGIEYFSASRNQMRTFFHESYVINNPEDRERIPDPRFANVPEQSSMHVFQRDSSFGSNVYELTYQTQDDAIWLAMTNLTQMFYQGILPALGPELLKMHLVVRPVGDQLLFYGASAARPGFLFGMEGRVQRSFYNRLVALHDWFIDQIEQQ